ncbi:MAG TPA: hypothetical protein DCZ95_11815 [Verrucomicrobia bacterium]|nr:MAG: hypothetical protein A2X46_13865 [Lentisphaerae bacterium GWF2_57_35]HBA84772.1 hypothetical protein [Verrucomicrobiota bacterium]
MKKASLFSIAFLAIILAACRSTAPAPATPAAALPRTAAPLDIGVVVHVNERMGYAIVRCAVLPSTGEEVKIYRNDKEAARLRISGPQRRPYFSADVTSGRPRRGDRVRQVVNEGVK